MVYLVCVRMSLILLLILSVFVGDSMEQETITPVKYEVNVLQGTDITLSCNYKGNVNYLQWYRQYPRSRPECLLLILQSSMYVKNTSITTPRHTGRLNEEKTRVDLKISSAILEDSALYYCALQPTVTGNPDTPHKNLSRALGINSSSYEEEIISATNEEHVLEGDGVTLSCNYTGSYGSDTLLWYQQYPRSKPEFLLLLTEGGLKTHNESTHPRLSVKLNDEKTHVDLLISSAEVTDSALYYCALKPTVTGNPETLFFSFGQSLNPVTTKELVQEGRNVHLSCKHDGTVYNLQWYDQYPRSKPELILYITPEGSIFKATPPHPRLTVSIDKVDKHVDLKISSDDVTDSALFYRAMKTTVTGNSDTLCEDLTPLKKEEYCLEGTAVTLSYNYSRTATGGDQFYWYHQDTAQRPEFLLYISGSGFIKKADPLNTRISAKLNEEKNRLDLEISSAEVTDSALYYCAVRPTVTGNLHTLYKNLSRDHISRDFLWFFYDSLRAKPPYPHLTVKLNKEKTCVDREISSAEVRDCSVLLCCRSYNDRKLRNTKWLQKGTVVLSCNYTSGDYLQWYRQYPKSAPKLLVTEYADITPGFTLNHDKNAKRMDLEIFSAEMTDSALYYCALRPTVTGNQETLYKNLEHLIEGRNSSFEGDINPTSPMDYPRNPPRLSAQVHTDHVDLEITSIDSALYYCAMEPKVTGNTDTNLLVMEYVDITSGFTLNHDKKDKHDSMEQVKITPVKPVVNALQGTDITLSCNYKGNVNFLQWYRQYPQSRPECLLLILPTNKSTPEFLLLITEGGFKKNNESTLPRLSVKLNDEKTSVDLKISSAVVTLCSVLLCHEAHSDTLEDDITPTSPEEYFMEGSRVKLSCNYTVKADSLLWYRQYSGSGLQFLYLITTTNKPHEVRGDQQDLQLSVTLNKERTRVDLEISSAEVTDSALYYCALQPTVTGNPEPLYKNLTAPDKLLCIF
ncbi:unnamed protein product [Coregonus sp. 'balchen']|nr:unnamed protein product [Coregonus sp. 'balchen']